MAQRTNQRLDDVKLTLQRLQRITSDSSDGSDFSGEGALTTAVKSRAALAWSDRTAPVKAPPRRHTPLFALAGLSAFSLIGTAGLVIWQLSGPERIEPEKTTAAIAVDAPVQPTIRETPSNLSSITSQAQELIDTGKVASARRMLTDIARQSPEAALMLARSYDPNFLKFVSFADAAADAEEAERWYRAWHEIASQKGLVMEADRLERIIKAMK